MAQSYTPGLIVTPQITLQVNRQLPIAGRVLVEVGQQVDAEQVVAESEIPGNVFPINLANALGASPGDIPRCMRKEIGEAVQEGEVLARSGGLFGWFPTDYHSKYTGTLETVSHVTGQVIIRGNPIPIQVNAFVTGEVVKVVPERGVVIKSQVSQVQGIFGIGGEAYGPIRVVGTSVSEPVTAEMIKSEHRGALVIGGARMTAEAIQKAIEYEVAGLVAGGIDDADLKEILGYDLGVAITGTERIGPVLMITEGFGDIAMATRTRQLFESREGSRAAINGATQIRAGVMRPEVLITLETGPDQSGPAVSNGVVEGVLEPGVTVRLIRDPYFGKIGRVDSLPAEPQVLESGSKARVLTVDCGGETIMVPRANVEIVAE